MREVTYEDKKGRLWRVLIPDTAPDSAAAMGVVIGPPSLDELDLPKDLAVKLHNQLFHRRLFTLADAERRRADVLGAFQAALKVDVQRVIDLYRFKANTKEG